MRWDRSRRKEWNGVEEGVQKLVPTLIANYKLISGVARQQNNEHPAKAGMYICQWQ